MKHKKSHYHLLADIGNTRMHLFDGKSVIHLSVDEAIGRYAAQKVYYISVNHAVQARIQEETQWENISNKVHLLGEYETMGVDRRALCLSHDDGIFIDAGSAITVDKVCGGYYEGGWIMPGLEAMRRAYASISPVLDIVPDTTVELMRLPRTTAQQISYGIIAPIKALVERESGDLPIYVTGGDGARIASLFSDAIFDESLIFRGLKRAMDRGLTSMTMR